MFSKGLKRESHYVSWLRSSLLNWNLEWTSGNNHGANAHGAARADTKLGLCIVIVGSHENGESNTVRILQKNYGLKSTGRDLIIVTVGEKPKGGVRDNYKKFLSILKPTKSGYDRMRMDQFPTGKGGERWGKILTNDNYVETISHYIHTMRLG